MKALVTGASGFLGANVVKELLASGAEVRALVLPDDPAPNLAGLEGVERVSGDVTDKASVREAVEGCDTVFHLAAIYKLWLRDPALIYRVNIDGTRTVLEEAGRASVKRIVHTSSAITCGFPRPGEVSDETTPYQTEQSWGNYRSTKYLSEELALDYARRGLPVTVVNPTVPLGWGDIAPTPTGALIVNYLNGLLSFVPRWCANLVSVRDVARGHVAAATRGQIGEKYILGGENLALADVMKILDQLTGFGIPRITVSPAVLLPLAYAMEFVATWITHREPLMSVESARVMSANYVFDVSKARRELGIDPLPARVALEEGVEWFMSTPLVKESRKHRYRARRGGGTER